MSRISPVSIPSAMNMVVTPVSFIAVEHCPLDGRGAPVLGQQGAVDIDTAHGRQFEDLLGQQLAVGHHRDEVGVQFLSESHRLPRCAGWRAGTPAG